MNSKFRSYFLQCLAIWAFNQYRARRAARPITTYVISPHQARIIYLILVVGWCMSTHTIYICILIIYSHVILWRAGISLSIAWQLGGTRVPVVRCSELRVLQQRPRVNVSSQRPLLISFHPHSSALCSGLCGTQPWSQPLRYSDTSASNSRGNRIISRLRLHEICDELSHYGGRNTTCTGTAVEFYYST